MIAAQTPGKEKRIYLLFVPFQGDTSLHQPDLVCWCIPILSTVS